LISIEEFPFAPDSAAAYFASARLRYVKVRNQFHIEFQCGRSGWVSIAFSAFLQPD
jgi:hypothetical protein